MNKKTMTLEQYNKKYRNRTQYLLKLKKSDADIYNKKFEHVVGNKYLFNGRKWQLIGDTYYQIPRPISFTWFRNLHAGVQVATCALLGVVVVGGAATPLILNYLNGDYIVVDSKEVIFTYSKDDAGNINANIKTIDNTYEIKSIVVKTSDYDFIKDQDYTFNVESGDIFIKSESIKEHQGKIHVVPAVTAVQVESVECERTFVLDYNETKSASGLNVKIFPENAHDKTIKDYDIEGGLENSPFEVIDDQENPGKYKLRAKKSGTAKLTIYAGDNNAKVSAICYVTVKEEGEKPTDYPYLTFSKIDDQTCSVSITSTPPNNIVIPEKIKFDDDQIERKVTKFTNPFYYIFDNVKTITFPSTLETIEGYALMKFENLEAINFNGESNLNTLGVGAFLGCKKLEWFKISNKLTSSTSIGNSAFNGCTSIKFILDGDSNVFSVSDDKTMLFDKNKTILFASPSVEGKADLSIYPSLETIYTSSFMGNDKLTEIKFSKSIKTIPNQCFTSCVNLNSVIFPDDSILETIEGSAFSSCKSLKSIVIPATVKSIGSSAFYCPIGGLDSAVFKDTIDKWTIGEAGKTPETETYDVSSATTNATNLKCEDWKACIWTRNQ